MTPRNFVYHYGRYYGSVANLFTFNTEATGTPKLLGQCTKPHGVIEINTVQDSL
jgi:hypothetical protein